ncbi:MULTISPECIES: hypothetical protein [unclassified Streptomyces]|uniref:hypothetical protein n=1 Tax=unclassified Streptomyces TaxID=2593676 RepID=UPI0033E28CF9
MAVGSVAVAPMLLIAPLAIAMAGAPGAGATLLQAAADVKVKYRETARGGLAVNVIEC